MDTLAYGCSKRSNGSFAIIMPKETSIDIDDEMDFKIAEALSMVSQKK